MEKTYEWEMVWNRMLVRLGRSGNKRTEFYQWYDDPVQEQVQQEWEWTAQAQTLGDMSIWTMSTTANKWYMCTLGELDKSTILLQVIRC